LHVGFAGNSAGESFADDGVIVDNEDFVYWIATHRGHLLLAKKVGEFLGARGGTASAAFPALPIPGKLATIVLDKISLSAYSA
jgi:hypothetical protein